MVRMKVMPSGPKHLHSLYEVPRCHFTPVQTATVGVVFYYMFPKPVNNPPFGFIRARNGLAGCLQLITYFTCEPDHFPA